MLFLPRAKPSPREAAPTLPVAPSATVAEPSPFIQLLLLCDVNICRVAFVRATSCGVRSSVRRPLFGLFGEPLFGAALFAWATIAAAICR